MILSSMRVRIRLSFEDQAVLQFFETGTRNPDRGGEAGWRTALRRAVGCRHRPAGESSGYFRAKLAPGERLITNSGLAYTILRATQFFEFVGGSRIPGAGMARFMSPAS